MLLAAYRCKPAKTVFLISTMHKNPVLENDAKSKPELVKFYNQNKVGVDCIDQMIRLYSTRTTTRRWSFAVWCNFRQGSHKRVDHLHKNYRGKNQQAKLHFCPRRTVTGNPSRRGQSGDSGADLTQRAASGVSQACSLQFLGVQKLVQRPVLPM